LDTLGVVDDPTKDKSVQAHNNALKEKENALQESIKHRMYMLEAFEKWQVDLATKNEAKKATQTKKLEQLREDVGQVDAFDFKRDAKDPAKQEQEFNALLNKAKNTAKDSGLDPQQIFELFRPAEAMRIRISQQTDNIIRENKLKSLRQQTNDAFEAAKEAGKQVETSKKKAVETKQGGGKKAEESLAELNTLFSELVPIDGRTGTYKQVEDIQKQITAIGELNKKEKEGLNVAKEKKIEADKLLELLKRFDAGQYGKKYGFLGSVTGQTVKPMDQDQHGSGIIRQGDLSSPPETIQQKANDIAGPIAEQAKAELEVTKAINEHAQAERDATKTITTNKAKEENIQTEVQREEIKRAKDKNAEDIGSQKATQGGIELDEVVALTGEAAKEAATAAAATAKAAEEIAKKLSDKNFDPFDGIPQFGSGRGFATGGYVNYLDKGGFPGGPRGTDTIPAWLSPGEYVWDAATVKRFFPLIQQIHQRPNYLANGGDVSVNFGDINVNNNGGKSISAREVAREISREIRRGTISFSHN
jgi:hypothetical protein